MTSSQNQTLEMLWEPTQTQIDNSNMIAFIKQINHNRDLAFDDYTSLYQWSVTDGPAFWDELWKYLDIISSSPYTSVVDNIRKMPGAKWFEGAKLNFAENLLRYSDDQTAIIFRGEQMAEARKLSYAELTEQVRQTASAMRNMDVVAGDRVVGFMPNIPETIIAMLAAASIGAIWSSCSPDFGIKGVLDRFERLEPKLLFTADAYGYNGKTFNCLDKVASIFGQLSSHPKVVVVPYMGDSTCGTLPNATTLDNFLATADASPLIFEQLPFDHPLYIMFSSGTTGLPKCMVQSGGGVLLNQLKEHVLHVDLKREDNLFYFTTCGWMMWNWMVAALGAGATITLFDGSPFAPQPDSLFRLAHDERITVFGTSAKYLAALEKERVKPGELFDLSALRAVLSTGSPLSEESFDYVYRDIKAQLCLSSIAGGTDLNGCFAGGNPIGPVYRGELQCCQLGMDVHAYNDDGQSVLNEKGELVCAAAFPSMPIYFWGDDDEGSLYHDAYFDVYSNIWRHGDFIEINDHGGVKIFGRSDATLNPGGVRIGTSEIYRQVEGIDEILDSIVIGQDWDDDVRVVLFVKLRPEYDLNDILLKKIRTTIRTQCSPRHVPAKVIAVQDIPYTISGKKVELAVRKVVHGEPVKNVDALANPDSLQYYKNLSDLII